MIFFHTQAIHHPASSSETTTESHFDEAGCYDMSEELSEVSRHISLSSITRSRMRISDLDLFFGSVVVPGFRRSSKPNRTGPKINPF